MSALQRLPAVFVACAEKRLAPSLKKLLPMTEVIDLQFNQSGSLCSDDHQRVLEEAEVLLAVGKVLSDVMHHTKKLRWAQCTWAGVEGLFTAQKTAPDAIITRTGGVYGRAMAEYVLGYILARERYVIELQKAQEESKWEGTKYSDYRSMSEITICILGLGDIGKEVARLCKASGMTVYGVTRSVPTEDQRCPAVDCYGSLSDLADVLPACDYLCNILPSTQCTVDLLSGDILSHCRKKKTVLINIGRGNIISEEGLVAAINKGWLGGAVLDVFKEEPLPASSPLWTLPGVTVTPHCSGLASADPIAKAFVKNYELYCKGEELEYMVDWQRGY